MIRPLLLGFALLAPVCAILLFRVNAVAALAILFVSHLLLLYPTLVPHSRWWGPVVRSFETPGRDLWITIDDGPDEAHTARILDLLDRYSAQATFFVIGERVRRAPELTREIVRRGHTIANHTSSHPSGWFWCFPPRAIAREIDGCAMTLRHAAGVEALYFRAPAGLKNWFVHPALSRRGLRLIGWSARGFDTVATDPAAVAARIVAAAAPGGIVLLHEGHRLEVDPQFDLKCIELTLQGLANRGYRFVIPRPEQLRAR